jgi:hypothetical protein
MQIHKNTGNKIRGEKKSSNGEVVHLLMYCFSNPKLLVVDDAYHEKKSTN